MYLQGQNGLLSTFRQGWRNRSPVGIAIALLLISFYLILYFEDYFRYDLRIFTSLAQSIGLQDRWLMYGFLYSLAMVLGGTYYLLRHGNSRYNQLRIATNIVVQVMFGFSVPYFMKVMKQPDFYFSYIWPLKIEYFYPDTLSKFPFYIVLYSAVASLLIMPLLAMFTGKRWYCSWVCGCGGLANTFGDPWRHLTSKATPAWRFEQITVHTVMLLAVVSTGVVAVDFMLTQSDASFRQTAFHAFAFEFRGWYGLIVGAILAGVVGVGLYPIFGPRVWCRNFCPMAAMLGLIQKAGRYRIAVKPDMCISCGNCSTYCEMGIDVRSYAQNNQSFTRASCVGCGMCAHMCPRGVLRLEASWKKQGDKKRAGLPVIDL